MTQKEINIKLVSDVVDIYDSAAIWNKDPDDPHQSQLCRRSDKLEAIRLMMNSNLEYKIVDKLNQLLTSLSTSGKNSVGYITKEFISGTISLLRFRIEASDNMQLEKIPPQIRPQRLSQEVIDEIQSKLLFAGASAIISYREAQEFSSQEELLQEISKHLDRPTSQLSLEIIPVKPGELREKNTFLGHRIWVHTPILPIVRATVVKK